MGLFLMNRTFQLTVWWLEVQKGAVGQAISSQVRRVEEQKEGEGKVGEGGQARLIPSWRAHTWNKLSFSHSNSIDSLPSWIIY